MMRTKHTLLIMSASVIALAGAMPAMAADGPTATAATAAPNDAPGGDDTEIVVTGIRASIAASLNAKRNSDVISEVITAQDIGKFPDKNVADSLGRLTGVNVVTGSANAGGFGENQSVSIRGTDPSLNLTLLDGHSLATGDWFVLDQQSGGRSFNFSMLPSELVGQLEVYKSAQADLPEGGVGGTINVHMRRPLDLAAGSVSITAQMVHNDLAGGWQPQISGVASWKNADETFGILASGFYEKRDFRRDGQEFLGYASVDDFDGSGQTVSFPTLIGDAYFTQRRVRKGGNLALQFKPTDRLELDLSGLYTRMDANNVNVNSMAWVTNVVGANSTPGTPAYALQDYTTKEYGGVNFLTGASWANTTADGQPVNGRVQDDIFRDAYSSTWSINLDAKWDASDLVTISGEVGYTKGKGATTDTEAWETFWHTGMSYAFDGKHANLTYPGLPTDPTSADYLNNYFNWSWGGKIVSPDKEFYFREDMEFHVDSAWLKSFKTGVRYTDHTRSLDYDAYGWAGNGLYSGTNTIGLGTVFDGAVTPDNYSNGIAGSPGYALADRDKVVDQLDNAAGGRQFSFYPPQSFSVHEKTYAAYAMAKLGNDRDWRGNIGVRAIRTQLETTQYSSNAPNITISNQFGNFGAIQDDNNYWNVLPSANLTYNATENVLLRAAVAKVMARPGYAQLAGAFSLDDLGLTGTAGGNPHLKPFSAWQYNLAAEWYYTPHALFSVGVFMLDIQNYITSTTTTLFYQTQQHPQGANFLVTAPINGGGGTNKGVEVNWQQPIAWGFGVQANYTYSDAKKDKSAVSAADNFSRVIDGNSKHTFNVTGYFENDLLSARVAYSYRSKFRSGIDRSTPMWQDNFGQLDASLLVHVIPQVDLSFDAQNITNSKLYYFVGNPAVPRAYYDNGRTFYVGARLNF